MFLVLRVLQLLSQGRVPSHSVVGHGYNLGVKVVWGETTARCRESPIRRRCSGGLRRWEDPGAEGPGGRGTRGPRDPGAEGRGGSDEALGFELKLRGVSRYHMKPAGSPCESAT